MKPVLLKTIFIFLCFPATLLSGQQPYFQQDVDYEIRVSLDDEAHFLHGSLELDYRNNSPDELTFVYFHLWPNAFVNNETAFARQKKEENSKRFLFAPDSQRGYIDMLEWTVDGQAATTTPYNEQPDIVRLDLPEPLPPGGKIRIETPFRVKIPNSFSRLGHIGQQYQLTQWYPKPAVYDRNGWHPMPYLDQGEFYSEFGTYDVYIDVPASYVVGATGDLSPDDPEWEFYAAREALSRKMLDKLKEEDYGKPRLKEELENSGWLEKMASKRKTLHFHQEKVHDFAWFTDKYYYLLADTVQLPYSKQTVRCVAMFTDAEKQYWVRAPQYIKQSVYDYSLWNGDYPYAHATAVDGALSAGAGMEYPNITVLGAGGSFESLEQVTMHEVGHNWFYGILGSNEREFPWMDEGLNTFMENRYWRKHHQGKSAMVPEELAERLNIEPTGTATTRLLNKFSAFEGLDQPIQYPAAEYTQLNYGAVVYMETGIAFEYLEDYLGEEITDKAFRTYFDRWKFKHPQPEDIQAVFEEVSGQDLNWFFGPFLQKTPLINFGIKKADQNQVVITNRSADPMPAPVILLDEEGKEVATYWSKPFVGQTTVEFPDTEYHKAYVYGDQYIPDWKPKNNFERTSGLLRSARKPALHFGYAVPAEDQFDLNVLPAYGFNTTDGNQLGLLLYHGVVPRQPFNFHIMPMYAFRSSSLTGSAGFTYRWLPQRTFRKIELQAVASSFSTFIRSKQSLTFFPQQENRRALLRHRISLENHLTGTKPQQGGDTSLDGAEFNNTGYARVRYSAFGKNALRQLGMTAELGSSYNGIMRLSGSLSSQHTFGPSGSWELRGRIFGGFTESLGDDLVPVFLAWGSTGSRDAFGQNYLIDRAGTNDFYSRQVLYDQGAMRTTEQRLYDQYLVTFNGTIHTPLPVFQLYADVGIGQRQGSAAQSSEMWVAGLRWEMLDGGLAINLPFLGTLYGTSQIAPESWREWHQGINFSLDLLRVLRRQALYFADF